MFDKIRNSSSFLKILQKASVAVEKEEGNRERYKTRDCTRRQALEKIRERHLWFVLIYLPSAASLFCDTVLRTPNA
jgi:hypothetical protein